MKARRPLVAASVCLSIGRAALADPPSPNVVEADRLFREGQAQLDAGHVSEACGMLRDSQRLDPKLGRLLNLAYCHERQGAFASAWREYSSAAVWAGQKGQDERAAFARSHAMEVSAHVCLLKLEITAGQEPSVLRIDREPLAREEWSMPVPVDPGDHELLASAEGKKPLTMKIVATQGAMPVAVPVLEDLPAEPLSGPTLANSFQPPEPAAPILSAGKESLAPRPRWTRTVGWISEGVGAVALSAGVVFGVRALAERNDAAPFCPAKLCDPQGQSFIGEARTSAVLSTVSLGVAVAAMGAGTTLIVLSRDKKTEAVRAGLRPALGPRGGGLGLEGAW